MFATAFYAVIDLSRGSLSYACAGHPGAILEATDGVQQIASERSEKGPGLGLIPGAVFPVGSLPLERVKRLVLYTDGIIEAQNGVGESFLEDRLMAAVAASTKEELDPMLGNVLEAVSGFSGSAHFDDDVCMLGIEIRKSGD
jgi:sigma-B regulation protein RsbU (phosphoserine phosphatase)